MQYNWAWNFFKFSPWLQFKKKKKTTKIKELQKKTEWAFTEIHVNYPHPFFFLIPWEALRSEKCPLFQLWSKIHK